MADLPILDAVNPEVIPGELGNFGPNTPIGVYKGNFAK